MFDHVTIRVADRAASARFYGTVLATLGIERTYAGDDLVEWDDYSLVPADAAHPVTRRQQRRARLPQPLGVRQSRHALTGTQGG